MEELKEAISDIEKNSVDTNDTANMNVDSSETVIRNRRYKRMMELMEKEDFFNEENIKMIEPLLYYIYIGKYKRNGGVRDTSLLKLSEIGLQAIDQQNFEIRLEEEYQQYSQEHDGKCYFEGADEEAIETEEEISMRDLEENEDELIRIIMKKFVDGKLPHAINYDLIDNTTQYDDHKQIQRDCEDEYFDSEEPSDQVEDSEYTGEQDF